MVSSASCMFITIALVGLFVVVAITLNAATLGIIIKRFDELNISNRNPSLLNSSLVEATRIADVMGHLSEFYRIAMVENGTRAINTRGFNQTLDYITDYLSANTNYLIRKTYFPIRSFQLASNPILLTSSNSIIINRTYSTDLSKAEFFYIQYSTSINLTDFVSLTAIPNVGCLDEDWLNANPSPSGRTALVKRGVCDFAQKATLAGYMNFGPRIFRPNRFGPVRNSGDFSVRTESPIRISVQILNKFN
jgi:hypothetical protein